LRNPTIGGNWYLVTRGTRIGIPGVIPGGAVFAPIPPYFAPFGLVKLMLPSRATDLNQVGLQLAPSRRKSGQAEYIPLGHSQPFPDIQHEIAVIYLKAWVSAANIEQV